MKLPQLAIDWPKIDGIKLSIRDQRLKFSKNVVSHSLLLPVLTIIDM